jgi:hypothetical protein
LPAPLISENTPSGMPVFSAARVIAPATSSDVPGCAEWPLTTTGQPAASAEAVSPPATEKASGKLLAPNTVTGPAGPCAAQVGLGRGRAIGDGVIDARAQIVAEPQLLGEQAELAGGAAALAGQPRLGQAAFLHRPLDQCVAQRLDLVGDRFEELGALLARQARIDRERRFGGRAGGLDIVGGGDAEARLDLRAGGRGDRLEAGAIPRTRFDAMNNSPVSATSALPISKKLAVT